MLIKDEKNTYRWEFYLKKKFGKQYCYIENLGAELPKCGMLQMLQNLFKPKIQCSNSFATYHLSAQDCPPPKKKEKAWGVYFFEINSSIFVRFA